MKEKQSDQTSKEPLDISCGNEECSGFPKKGYRYRTVASQNKDGKKVVKCRSCGTQKVLS